ncbi:DNA-processing protein DprA [Pseudotabrizicola sp. L79]|uniref:DNA-processing protein DprA n=1 Tax=Pseudotabrizicola sp. L79 TaxID=3118402 RepID=UPI002F9255D3
MGQTSKPTPHPTPLDDDPVDCLRLIRSRRVGAVTWHRLMAEHGSAAAALRALPEVALAAGVENYSICPIEVVRKELADGRLAGAQLILWGDPRYPQALTDLPDAPPALWVKGDVSLLARPMVALVGARNASSLGLRMARRLAEGLGQAGCVIVSGLARGIDAEAHQATLATGTVAVQAGGVDVIYPEENARLAAEIAEKGCLVSEHCPGLIPQARHFPQRNRIVSGLSRAVVVVEAAARSGSLITARNALDQGRDVLAVPGHPFDARASGCNMLIRDGALLVRGPQDVLEVVGGQVVSFPEAEVAPQPAMQPAVLPGPVPARRPLSDMAAVHSQILARLGPSPLAEDQLIRDLSLPPATVVAQLVTLELEGRVHRAPGGLINRID